LLTFCLAATFAQTITSGQYLGGCVEFQNDLGGYGWYFIANISLIYTQIQVNFALHSSFNCQGDTLEATGTFAGNYVLGSVGDASVSNPKSDVSLPTTLDITWTSQTITPWSSTSTLGLMTVCGLSASVGQQVSVFGYTCHNVGLTGCTSQYDVIQYASSVIYVGYDITSACSANERTQTLSDVPLVFSSNTNNIPNGNSSCDSSCVLGAVLGTILPTVVIAAVLIAFYMWTKTKMAKGGDIEAR